MSNQSSGGGAFSDRGCGGGVDSLKKAFLLGRSLLVWIGSFLGSIWVQGRIIEIGTRIYVYI